MSIVPLHDQVLVVDIPREQEIDGVYLPETSRTDVYFSKVMAVGPSSQVKVGDLIIRGMYSGIPIRLDGVEFYLLKELECLGRIV